VPPRVLGGLRIGHSKKLTTLTFAFSEPLNPSSAGNPALYHVASGAKKKHKVVAYTKTLKIKSTAYNPTTSSVTLDLARTTRPPLQVTIAAGLAAANGASTGTSLMIELP
jgi:hypothetical protein